MRVNQFVHVSTRYHILATKVLRKMATNGAVGPFDRQIEDWVSYTERMQQWFVANDIKDGDKQRAVLLSTCGAQTYRLIRNLVTPRKPTDRNFKDLVDMVAAHFCPPPSVTAQRFTFNSRTQREGETLAEFVAELRRLSEHCEFAASLDDMLRDRLVCGVRDSRLQKRLLAESDLTFQKAFDLCQASEVADKNVKELQAGQRQGPKLASPSVMVVRGGAPAVCYRCNSTSHLAKDCKFKSAKCHHCGKVGHIQKACRSKGKTRDQEHKGKKRAQPQRAHQIVTEDDVDSEEDSSYDIFKLSQTRVAPVRVNLSLEQVDIPMEVDTGASVTLISQTTLDKLREHAPTLQLHPSEEKLRTYTGEEIPVMGRVTVKVQHRGQEEQLSLVVVAGEGPSLLGRDWLSKLKLDWKSIFSTQVQETLQEVLERHEAVFGPELGCVQGTTAKLQVDPEAAPRFCKARTVPYALRSRVEQELQRLVSQGVIEQVEFSDWAAPIVPIVKPDGSIRICGDYKTTVNRVAKLDPYPIPRIEDLFASLSGGKLFSKLDLAHAYQQIPLDDASKPFVVINTHKGLFQYNRLPFGVASAPAIFQRAMESILQGIEHVTVYIDDILVTGRTEAEHLQHLAEVLSRLEKAGIRLKKDKCAFMLKSVEYLGHIISAEGLHPTTEKIRAITAAPTPQDVTQLKSFLGLINYYSKFLPNLSHVLAPLYKLLQKTQKWTWGPAQATAFQKAKEELTSSRVLVHYNPDLPVVLDCDASPYGIGAVLSHQLEDGQMQPIAFASRSLTRAEKKYSQLDKEGLAIVFGITKFHQYLAGRTFAIYSDHKPLQHIFAEDRPIPTMASARIQRWALTLSAYNYTISYKPGSQHGNTDLLSR